MNNKPANLILGLISIVADLFGIAGFILSGEVVKFWSAGWLVYVFGIPLLLGIGLLFLSQIKDELVFAFFPIAAGIYALLSCLAIFGIFAALAAKALTFTGFVGMAVLAIFPSLMALAVSSLSPKPEALTKGISYGYATTGIFAVIFLLVQYSRNQDYSLSMIGEFAALAMIGVGFGVFGFINEA